MRTVVLYHPEGEGALTVERYVSEFGREYPANKLELISLEQPDGANLAKLYGVNVYPAILVMAEDGQLTRIWQGKDLPLMSELSGYAAGA